MLKVNARENDSAQTVLQIHYKIPSNFQIFG